MQSSAYNHPAFEPDFDFRSMPKPKRRPNGLWDKVILPRARAIVLSYEVPVTLRQLHYRLVSEKVGWYSNTQADYDQLSTRTAELRRVQDFPPLLDSTRGVSVNESFDGIAEALDHAADYYSRDLTEGQEIVPVLIAEKATLQGLLREWFGKHLGLMVCALRGYQSESFEREIRANLDDDRRYRAIYVGDFDASGMDIERNAKRYLGNGFESWARVALTFKQIKGLEEKEIGDGKITDSRARAFIEKYGRNIQVEVEAMDPERLRKLIQKEIDKTWDEEAYQAALKQESDEQDELRQIADDYR